MQPLEAGSFAVAGKILTIPASIHDTIKLVKQNIFKKTGVDPADQIVFFAGKVLSDNRCLSDYLAKLRGNTLHVSFKVKQDNKLNKEEKHNIDNNISNANLSDQESINKSSTDLNQIEVEIKTNKIWGYAEAFGFDPSVLVTLSADDLRQTIHVDYLAEVKSCLSLYKQQSQKKQEIVDKLQQLKLKVTNSTSEIATTTVETKDNK